MTARTPLVRPPHRPAGRGSGVRSALVRLPVALLSAGLLAGTGGCATALPRPMTTVGSHGRSIVVLVDTDIRPSVARGIDTFVTDQRRKVVWAAVPAPDVASRVKDGATVDAVVLPDGAALDRVRNELISAPLPLGRRGEHAYWIAPVTSGGRALASWLATATGRSALRAAGLQP